jgi:hypothetical protein
MRNRVAGVRRTYRSTGGSQKTPAEASMAYAPKPASLRCPQAGGELPRVFLVRSNESSTPTPLPLPRRDVILLSLGEWPGEGRNEKEAGGGIAATCLLLPPTPGHYDTTLRKRNRHTEKEIESDSRGARVESPAGIVDGGDESGTRAPCPSPAACAPPAGRGNRRGRGWKDQSLSPPKTPIAATSAQAERAPRNPLGGLRAVGGEADESIGQRLPEGAG